MLSRLLITRSIYFLLGLGILGTGVWYYLNQPRPCKTAAAGKVAVRVAGLSWDSDSAGFAFLQGLSREEGAKVASRLNARVHVDGQPERFALTETGPGFEIEFETDQPTFRLIAEGKEFPPTISQPYKVPKGGCDINIGKLNSPRGDGSAHTWPLPIVASIMQYKSWQDLLADNNAVVRILVRGSGEEGVPGFANNSLIKADGTRIKVYPFFMDKKITFLEMRDKRTGAYIVVIPFSAGEPADKDVSLQVTDTITEAKWNPPRPWKFDPKTISVRNGYATDIRISPSADQ